VLTVVAGAPAWGASSGGSATAANGLSISSGNVVLGGTLTGATTITQSNNNLTFATGTARTIVNGNFETTGAVYAKVRTYSGTANVNWAPDDYIVICTGAIPVNVLCFPDPVANVGRVLCIRNNSTGGAYTPNKFPDDGSKWPFNSNNLAIGAALMVVSDGTAWHNFGK